MNEEYKEVYIEHKDNPSHIEINPEYVYLTIPANYVCVYHKLLAYMADFGKDIIDDCNTICQGHNKNIIGCWNMFQSAIACHNLHRDKEAELLLNYISKQLEVIYKGTTKTVYTGTTPIKITPNGELEAIASCNEGTPHFYVDTETGNLYEKYINSKTDGKVYAVDDNNLNVTQE